MKSTRRHELQENVLAIEIGRIAEFLKKRGNYLATGLLVVALIVFGFVFLGRRAQSKRLDLQHQWDVALTGSLKPEEKTSRLTALAEQRDNERIAALANVELGYEMASRALASNNAAERRELLNQAARWYQLAIGEFPKQDLAVAKAHFGMAKLRETVGDFKAAAAEYQKVNEITSVSGYPVHQLAELALLQLKTLQSPVRMVTTAPATQPTTAPAVGPTSAPAVPPATTTQPASRPVGG